LGTPHLILCGALTCTNLVVHMWRKSTSCAALDELIDDKTRERLAAAVGDQISDGTAATAPVVEVCHGRRGERSVLVACCFCPPSRSGKQVLHRHGFPHDSPEPGWRSAHCGGGDYKIIISPEQLAAERARVRRAEQLRRAAQAGIEL
jgi:hypothetical protein